MGSLINAVQQGFTKRNSKKILIKAANKARDNKNYAEAARLYSAYLVSNPLSAAIHIQCGHMNKELGRLNDAGRHYYIAYALQPNDSDLHLQLGHYKKVTGKLDEAIGFYQQAIELNPDNADAQRELTRAVAMARSLSPQSSGIPSHVLHQRVQNRHGGINAIDFDESVEHPIYRSSSNYAPVPSTGKELSLVGHFDAFDDGVAQGWAYDANNPHDTVSLNVIIDDRVFDVIRCDGLRKDIMVNMGHPTGRVGFRFETPLALFDGRRHRIGFRFPNGGILGFIEPGRPEQSHEFCEFDGRLQPKIRGVVDGLYQGHFQGWAIRKEPRATLAHGGCTIIVTCGGVRVGQSRADRWRGDVANHNKADPNCGFRIPVPDNFRKAYPQTFRFHVMPGNIELDNSPLTTTVLYDHLEATFAEVSETIERLYAEVVALRVSTNKLRIKPGQTIEEYDGWARKYYKNLQKRVVAARTEKCFDESSLVSVLIPTYRPLLSDFTAAVQSVIDQTYQNWELLIVDDASNQPALTSLIDEFCARDGRIRAITREKNGNISEATNTAIEAAQGEWVAFFDHDDLLVDVALEVMMTRALSNGASVLYSDEDKIDQAGYFSDPNLKPDWNHRFILGCNYVCHLLFVQTGVLRQVGPLRSKYNGAQDHDLVLRLSEHVPAAFIQHVPEILYHWRKTPNSTAVTVANKDYAVKAGVAAVNDHLVRIKKKAAVSSIDGLTIYKVDWLYKDCPKVCIIVPFRDQVEMTRLCLQRILSHTEWPDFDVIFINNWSITDEAADFGQELRRLPNVKVLDVDEEFNYARLNNLAAAQTDAKFLVFMNNDLLLEQKGWLRILVNEALADEDVGIVGGKLVYPNGSVQHAGLVVGEPEIGAYLHHGASPKEYGYTGRLVLPHEMTAVTAACMLVRADVFHSVGGFDEAKLKIAYNDIDLCLKVRSAGKKVIYAADFVAEHHESYTRGSDDSPEHEARFLQERQVMIDRWGEVPLFKQDPAYNPLFAAGGRKFYDLIEQPVV